MKRRLLLKMLALVSCLMFSLGNVMANEAYAVYLGSTLTFYYDNNRSSRSGMTYSMNSENSAPEWTTVNSNIYSVVFDASFLFARPASTCYWFYNMTHLSSISGIGYLNTTFVRNMSYMFKGCRNLSSIYLTELNTVDARDMSHMFDGCSGLSSLNLSSFNTSKVENMSGMFKGCTGLTSLDLFKFNTANVTNMDYMFEGCSNLTTIYVNDSWSTSSVLDNHSNNMFIDCTNLVGGLGTTYDANHVDKTYAHIDGGPSNPGYLTEKMPEAYAMYTSDNSTLTFYFDINRDTRTGGTTYNLNEGNVAPAWYNVSNITKVVFDPSFANARPVSTYSWFSGKSNLQSIVGINYLNTSEVTTMGTMFSNCRSLTSLDLSNFNTSNVTNMSNMFNYCTGLTNLDISNFNTSNVTNMSYMFYYCRGLTSLDLSSFNTSNVTNMNSMFYYCSGLTSLDVSSFNTSNVTNMNSMFYNCFGLSTLDVSSFDTENATNMSSMFSGCTGLSSLDVSNFITYNVTTMKSMFYNCSGLTSLDLGSINTYQVTNMSYMFCYCEALSSLDLNSFNTANVKNMDYMFYGCSNLTSIYVDSKWQTDAVTSSSNMFNSCTRLVGGMGTRYDESNPNDKTYAHIDGGPDNPGYLTQWKVAYMVYTHLNTTMTFYYDGLFWERPDAVYSLNTSYNDPEWYKDEVSPLVTHVVFDPSFADARPTSAFLWFYHMTNLESITGMKEYLNTSEMTNMCCMFDLCSSLQSIDVSNFNTSKVNDMSYMFSNCYELTTIYAGSAWSTTAVESSSSMFTNCYSLVGGNGTTYNESNPKDKTYARIDGGSSSPGYFTAVTIPGDLNDDGDLNISDVTALINYVMNEMGKRFNRDAADVNRDGHINISDVTALINLVMTMH